jgi:hypothetical protein
LSDLSPIESRPQAGSPISPDPNVVFLANLFGCAALGYWLIGQKQKAIVALVGWIALVPLTCFWGSGLVALFAAIDGYEQAHQLRAGHRIGQWSFYRAQKNG